MQVTICGHAGLFIETPETRVLVDPILRETPLASGGVVHTLARRLDLTKMPAPTLVVVTHAHLDHFDPESIARLSPDTLLIAPQDGRLLEHLRQLGFSRISTLLPWQSFTHEDIVLTATPSEAEIDEFGLLIRSKGATFWHMSDAEAEPEDAVRIAREFGPVHLTSVKYQPASRVQSQVVRSLGACFDKAEVVRSLETASLSKPRMAFPYASGVRFHGDHAWFNKHAFPFRADEIAYLLNRRLAPEGRAITVLPGDRFSIESGEVTHSPQTAEFVRHDAAGGGEIEWEPIEPHTLAGVEDNERVELRMLLDALLRGPFAKWISLQGRPEGILRHMVEYEVKWQLIVHAGGMERLEFAIDFSDPALALVEGRDRYANFFTHMAGKGLLRNLRGEAGPELLYACGDTRIYEKILGVKQGKMWAPPVQGWELFEQLPEPLMIFLRYRYKWGL